MKTNESREARLPEKVLVTGGGGFLGSAIVKRLIDRGDEARSLARNFYPQLEAMGVDQIQGDISDSATVARACEDRTIVYHVAAKPPPWGKYADYHQTNVLGTQNIIDGCLDQRQSRLIYTSTPSVVHNGFRLGVVGAKFFGVGHGFVGAFNIPAIMNNTGGAGVD